MPISEMHCVIIPFEFTEKNVMSNIRAGLINACEEGNICRQIFQLLLDHLMSWKLRIQWHCLICWGFFSGSAAEMFHFRLQILVTIVL